MQGFEYVDSLPALRAAAKEMKKCGILGVDIECENNMHHYGAYISIIQVSSERKHWIIDALAIKDMSHFLTVYRNPKIQKVFHDVSLDLGFIFHQYGVRPRNVFDTQLAALMLGEDEIGLASLLEKHFKVKKQSRFQTADWSRRPLPDDMLDYAITDTKYLIRLRNILKDQLRKAGRLLWFMQECVFLEKKELDYKEQDFFDLRGLRQLRDSERGILKKLFEERKRIAKRVNRPVHFVIRTTRLFDLAKNPPRSFGAWKAISGVHPAVRKNAGRLFEAVKAGRESPIKLPQRRRRFTPEQRDVQLSLEDVRNKLSEELGIQKQVILSKDQIIESALLMNLDSLRPWQRALVRKHVSLPSANL